MGIGDSRRKLLIIIVLVLAFFCSIQAQGSIGEMPKTAWGYGWKNSRYYVAPWIILPRTEINRVPGWVGKNGPASFSSGMCFPQGAYFPNGATFIGRYGWEAHSLPAGTIIDPGACY